VYAKARWASICGSGALSGAQGWGGADGIAAGSGLGTAALAEAKLGDFPLAQATLVAKPVVRRNVAQALKHKRPKGARRKA
jgi:hypothetical protein